MNTILLLAVVMLCVVVCGGHPHWFSSHGRGRHSSEEDTSRPPVLACSAGEVEEDCEENANCTGGPYSVSFKEKEYEVTFCVKPVEPSQACRVTDTEGNPMEDVSVITCPDGQTCSMGPFKGVIPLSFGAISFGNLRDKPVLRYGCSQDYGQTLRSKACKIGDTVAKDCGDKSSCTGANVTVNGEVLTFCQKNCNGDDSDEDTEDDDDTDQDDTENGEEDEDVGAEELLDTLNGCGSGEGSDADDESDEDDSHEGPWFWRWHPWSWHIWRWRFWSWRWWGGRWH